MFKNIQKELLLKNPLLWNLKIIPFAAFALLVHLVFFVIGYVTGAIDFTRAGYYNSLFDDSVVIFISVLIGILAFITWLVLYSRNNGFKSFYPKRNTSLFREWLLILVFCVLNMTYSVSYLYAKDLRAISYFSEEESNKRFEVISMASLFLEGGYLEGPFEWVPKEEGTDETVRVERDSFSFDNRKYAIKSLINKDIESFTIFTSEQDSLNRLRVKRWLTGNHKDSVQNLLDSYFKIMDEHQLLSNIDEKKWMELVYDYPEFTDYTVVGKGIRSYSSGNFYEDETNYQYAETVETEVSINGEEPFDSISKYVKMVNGQEFIYYHYYVSHQPLQNAYGMIASAISSPNVDGQFLLVMLYLSVGMSLLFFSFKVTSGRDWLIALVSMGVVGIFLGIFSLLGSGGIIFPIMVLLIFAGLLVYFIAIMKAQKSKQISGITLNQLLWLLPAVLPLVYLVTLEIIKDVNGYKIRYRTIGDVIPVEKFPRIEWMEDFIPTFMFLNILLLFFWMLILSTQIKKWKGIAEG